MTRTIDMTPTWPEALNMCKAVIENGTDEGKANAWAEIARMAEIAQRHVDLQRKVASVVAEPKPVPSQATLTAWEIKAATELRDVPMSDCSLRLFNNGEEIILSGNARVTISMDRW